MKQVKTLLAGALMTLFVGSAAAASFNDDRTDFRDETIYFAMTTRFYDGDPTNNVLCWDGQEDQIRNNDPCWRGDFKGLIDRLDYIKALGFTAVWVTPIVQNGSGFDYHGYHAMDFSKVDLRYESRKAWGASEDVTFQSLVDACHKRDMKIVLDIVLNHTGNFGEAKFAHLFDRNQNIRNQSTPAGSLIPDESKLGSGYFDLSGDEQYSKRFVYLKNTGGKNMDTHNYWHHYGYGGWDDPTRWWFQIAGDCVDLNTENDAVANYLVECYGKFIEMGVDGFRIDTTGHIARLSFNTVFIPKFVELGKKYENKRLNKAPFFMFGECCSRYSGVTYRDQNNLSCYYYTWDSPADLKAKWNHDASWWDSQVILEGDSKLYGNMALSDAEPSDAPTSDNAFLKNGAWHEPDYSKASNFWPIDFPVHYNFNNVASVLGNIKGGDKYYNDATYNVVYVDSHDYCPGPNDGIRFNGGTEQWAENLSFMFTCRGIPCLYYGSEVEFQKGKTIDKGPLLALKESGRAYFGAYLEGEVKATDFGQYTASGNVQKTLDGDLAHHIRRLNQIRAAVPALRKGQYTFDGCSANGGYAYKRAYKDSYALVAVNGGATFSNVPAGTYTDLITGKKYEGGGSITVDAPKNKGQLRVLVKGWNGGIVGEDGKFIYASSPVNHGGNPSFTDPGTTQYYGNDDIVGNPEVKFSPAGGTFNTEKLTVSVSLNETAVAGWYQVAGKSRVNLTAGATGSLTIGDGMEFGSTVNVDWGATSDSGENYTGVVSYRKVDPNASITVYVKANQAPNLYAWGKNHSGQDVTPCGAWPGKLLSNTTVVDGMDFYYFTFDDMPSVNIIFNNSGNQTPNIEGICEDTYFEYDGGSGVNKLNVNVTPVPTMKFSPNGGEFVGSITVNYTLSNATSANYQIGNNAKVNVTGNGSFQLGQNMADGQSITVKWEATNGTDTRSGQVTYTKVAQPSSSTITFYFDNSSANWGNVNAYIYGGQPNREVLGGWPGKTMSKHADTLYKISFEAEKHDELNVIFNNGNGQQTGDNVKVRPNAIYNLSGDTGESGIEGVSADEENVVPEFYNLQGMRIDNPGPGIYIMRRGNEVKKIQIR